MDLQKADEVKRVQSHITFDLQSTMTLYFAWIASVRWGLDTTGMVTLGKYGEGLDSCRRPEKHKSRGMAEAMQTDSGLGLARSLNRFTRARRS